LRKISYQSGIHKEPYLCYAGEVGTVTELQDDLDVTATEGGEFFAPGGIGAGRRQLLVVRNALVLP